MGVLNLWKILQTTSQTVNVADDIKNKTLAVDLSIWIVENANIGYYSSNTKPYLRTLFFRSKALIENGCKLIFIREGDVISLKQDTMKKRNQTRFGESSQSQPSCSQSQSKPIKNRSRFDHVADECCELLKSMGISVIRSPCGEAEKACAFLNMIGKCDGVLTNDSDVFLYGARCVYRNFCTDKKQADTIEKYEMESIEKTLGYDREMLVVLGLLLGCDYDPKGVPGCGKEMACKFLSEIREIKQRSARPTCVLDLLRNWSNNKNNRKYSKYEEKVRKLALAHAECIKQVFPNEEIIKEYMTFPKVAQIIMSEDKYLKIEWKRPNLGLFQTFNQTEQNWTFQYSAEKLIPLIIKFEHFSSLKRTILPKQINKTRHKDSVEYYEVIWFKMNSPLDADLSELTEYITLESTSLFAQKFPDLVELYQSQIDEKKNSRKNKKKKEKTDIEECNSLMELYEDYSLIETHTQVKIKKKETVKNKEHLKEKVESSTQFFESNLKSKNSKKKQTEIPYECTSSQPIFKPLTINLKTSYSIRDILLMSDEEEIKEIQQSKQKPFIQIDETIILDSDDDENNLETKSKNTKQASFINNGLDLNSILKSFENIRLESQPKDTAKDKVGQLKGSSSSNLDETLLPLSMRIKKKYGISPSNVFNK